MKNKQEVRKHVKGLLSNLSETLYEGYSDKIASRLFEDEDWFNAEVIGITVSRQPEVDTYPIIRKAWQQGKKVVVPKCNTKEKALTFRTLKDFSQLETVFYGLCEPIEDLTTQVEANQIDLMIVPGLAYTREGYRLGFGGGYYDRFLKNYTGKTISLAFSEQIISQFPIEEHDIPVSKIITYCETIK